MKRGEASGLPAVCACKRKSASEKREGKWLEGKRQGARWWVANAESRANIVVGLFSSFLSPHPRCFSSFSFVQATMHFPLKAYGARLLQVKRCCRRKSFVRRMLVVGRWLFTRLLARLQSVALRLPLRAWFSSRGVSISQLGSTRHSAPHRSHFVPSISFPLVTALWNGMSPRSWHNSRCSRCGYRWKFSCVAPDRSVLGTSLFREFARFFHWFSCDRFLPTLSSSGWFFNRRQLCKKVVE